MKRLTPILCVVYLLFMYQNMGVSSLSSECLNDFACKLDSFFKRWQVNLSAIKSNNGSDFQRLFRTLLTTVTSPSSSSSSSSSSSTSDSVPLKRVKSETKPADFYDHFGPYSSAANSAEDLVSLFGSRAQLLAASTAAQQESAVLLLATAYGDGSVSGPLPAGVAVNVVNVFASAPRLFAALPQPALNNALRLITDSQCAFCAVPPAVQDRFLRGLFGLSPGALVRVPKSVMVPVLRTIGSADDVRRALSPAAAVKLVTVLSLSRPLFVCLPAPALVAVLTYVAARPPAEILSAVPPSTLFGFVEGLLETLDDASPPYTVPSIVPAAVLAAVLAPTMTSRMLSVSPARTVDLLLAAVGSSCDLSAALPPSGLVSLFDTLAKSPGTLSTLDPQRLARAIVAVNTCPTVTEGLPAVLFNALLESVAVYLPSCFAYLATWAEVAK